LQSRGINARFAHREKEISPNNQWKEVEVQHAIALARTVAPKAAAGESSGRHYYQTEEEHWCSAERDKGEYCRSSGREGDDSMVRS